jgi:hypothetical protein
MPGSAFEGNISGKQVCLELNTAAYPTFGGITDAAKAPGDRRLSCVLASQRDAPVGCSFRRRPTQAMAAPVQICSHIALARIYHGP